MFYELYDELRFHDMFERALKEYFLMLNDG
jgi:hypothetical protein